MSQQNSKKFGATGFEPATTCTPCKYATKLRHAPIYSDTQHTWRCAEGDFRRLSQNSHGSLGSTDWVRDDKLRIYASAAFIKDSKSVIICERIGCNDCGSTSDKTCSVCATMVSITSGSEFISPIFFNCCLAPAIV